ncbi:unnamed protein product, partial [Acidithrix sp. C25]
VDFWLQSLKRISFDQSLVIDIKATMYVQLVGDARKAIDMTNHRFAKSPMKQLLDLPVKTALIWHFTSRANWFDRKSTTQ